MDVLPDIEHIDLAYQLINNMHHNHIKYIYRGDFNPHITTRILEVAEVDLENSEDTNRLRKKIFFIMIECLQNITKHRVELRNNTIQESGLFLIQKTNSFYFITTCNVVKREASAKIKQSIERINSSNSKQIRELYNKVLVNGKMSDKGGAGLGFIAMAKKSGQKFIYEFKPIDEELDYFYFRVAIPLSRDIGRHTKSDDIVSPPLYKTIELHQILNNGRIMFNFNGNFTHENFVSLISIVIEQTNGSSAIVKRLFQVLVDVLKNIAKYGSDIDLELKNKIGKSPGIFLLGLSKNMYCLTAGNYILHEKIDTLCTMINKVNTLSDDELSKRYQQKLIESKTKSEYSTELSFLEVRLLSATKLTYKFKEVNKRHSLFLLQVAV